MKNELNVKKFWELLRKYLPLKKNIGILLFLIFSQVFCTLYMPIAVMNDIYRRLLLNQINDEIKI